MVCAMNKSVLIGTFVKKERILNFLDFLKRKLGLNIRKIRIFEVKSNDYEYLITFKTYDKEQYLSKIKYSTVLHVKNNCLFSINALNKMIDGKSFKENKEYTVNWDNFKNKIIIMTRGELLIDDIEQITDMSSIILN